MDGMEQISQALSKPPTKVFLPGIGHRMVTTFNGKTIDTDGNDITDKLESPKLVEKKEPVEEGKRSDPVNMRFEEDPITLQGNTAIESFQGLRDLFLQKNDVDQATVDSLQSIETMIKMTLSQYEAQRNQ